MKYIRQLVIILAVSFAGELLRLWIPLPIPASIYGLVLLLLGLMSDVIPVERVKDTGAFLIEILPLMFIPAAVGLLESWQMIRPELVPIAIITIATTVIVMAVTGRVTQRMLGRQRRNSSGAYEIKRRR